ncbi:arfaptin-2-like [Sycon ciliatum]|uniref:arfaptin-2-like n=1 Tax=Sycon ciliatum TaxID=27933 RepID=UPI0020AB9AD7|eukprot:scpid49117/ scgid11552/ Arfaptin-1; ADP-ribosylation factor-interacting protein 1
MSATADTTTVEGTEQTEIAVPGETQQHLDQSNLSDVDLSSSPTKVDRASPAQQRAAEHVESPGDGTGKSDFSLPDTEVQARSTVPVAARLQSFATWGMTKVKCARQSMNERFGKVTKTVDTQMTERIESLREAQRNYVQIMNLAKKLSTQLRGFLETQRNLGDIFSEYGVRVTETDLQAELLRGGTVQRTVARTGDALVASLDHFVSSIGTLISKTMEDTFAKVHEYEAMRVQYDAFRIDVEQLQTFCDGNPANTAKQAKLEAALVAFETQKELFTVVRNELNVKLKFLDENKITVMQKQLVLLHNATSGFFTGDIEVLERCLKSYHIRRLDLATALPTSTEVKSTLQELPMNNGTGHSIDEF